MVSDGGKELERRRVLIVSYHFPPDAEVGGLRVEKFVKYLPCFGWTPTVLTVREKYYQWKDVNRGLDISCAVVRTQMFLSPREAYLKVKSLIRSLKRASSIKGGTKSETLGDGSLELNERKISSLKRSLLLLLWIPDDRIGWIYPAVKRALEMVKKHEIRTVLTTSPPHSVQIIGLILKKILKRRWVVDLRDPWTLPLKNNEDFYARINRWLERKVIENADVVIVTTEVVRRAYAEAYGGGTAEKFVCIPNGYDLEDFKAATANQMVKAEKLRMSYLGEFYMGRTPEIFLQAVADLVRCGHIQAQKLLIRFIGKVRNIGRRSMEDLVAELGLSSITELIEPVPYHLAIDYMVNSDVLLVFSPQPFYQPTKVFEYMGAGAWVIAFTPSGALADLVGQYSKGIVVDYSDVEGAKKALMRCYEEFLDGEAIVPAEDSNMQELLGQYERKNLTKQLSIYL